MQMQTGTGDPQTLAKAWDLLASELNAYGAGPTKSAKDWQTTFVQWKHHVRHEARTIKMQHEGTGGGPATCLPLCDIKQRALNAWGAKAVEGNAIGEVGRGNCVPAVIVDDLDVCDIAEVEIVNDVEDSVHATEPVPLSTTTLKRKLTEPKPSSSRAAKDRKVEELVASDMAISSSISRLADSVNRMAELWTNSQLQTDKIIANQEKMISNQEHTINMLLEKYL